MPAGLRGQRGQCIAKAKVGSTFVGLLELAWVERRSSYTRAWSTVRHRRLTSSRRRDYWVKKSLTFSRPRLGYVSGLRWSGIWGLQTPE